MSPENGGGKHVEFRRATGSEASPDAAKVREKHVLRPVPRNEGVCPPHVEFFSEDSVDGFVSDTPQWVAFCPECGSKLALEDHEACPFFGGREVDRNGFVVAVHCGYVESG
jgi:hypothetical protein